jgi:hypothetical protein
MGVYYYIMSSETTKANKCEECGGKSFDSEPSILNDLKTIARNNAIDKIN